MPWLLMKTLLYTRVNGPPTRVSEVVGAVCLTFKRPLSQPTFGADGCTDGLSFGF